MNAAELKQKSATELKSELMENLKEQFKLRMQKAAGQLSRPSEVKRVRRQIARIKTVLAQKQVAGE
ncbi:50S ribosomal protein L29 [Thiothrix litoralis]|jgi:large subunit ribosomal protein L29|uniref:Large ribosomal subunit protein uL29 n=2 Tax=Thiothrix TaxID=1030 RepID=A0ABY9MPI6_9GAMM|nr:MULTISPECIES: 50S ribosomal protein L29 [Thiothrix]QTR46192.1 50S ribosomal protein L29 [Thiothrix litoralis]WML89761.1 50S ribosomal protein L29 [Thiothrix lacustris]WMP18639.1 50S ribosomal protein L29 [Thiothrix lacustris]